MTVSTSMQKNLEQFIVDQLVKNFSVFSGTLKFSILFTLARGSSPEPDESNSRGLRDVEVSVRVIFKWI
jgi:hypothetical protein